MLDKWSYEGPSIFFFFAYFFSDAFLLLFLSSSILYSSFTEDLHFFLSYRAWIHILTSGRFCQMSLKLFLSFSAGDIISASHTQEVCDRCDVLSCCFYILRAQGVLWGSCRGKGNARGINVLAASYRTNSPTFPFFVHFATGRKMIKNYGTDRSTCGTWKY